MIAHRDDRCKSQPSTEMLSWQSWRQVNIRCIADLYALCQVVVHPSAFDCSCHLRHALRGHLVYAMSAKATGRGSKGLAQSEICPKSSLLLLLLSAANYHHNHYCQSEIIMINLFIVGLDQGYSASSLCRKASACAARCASCSRSRQALWCLESRERPCLAADIVSGWL